MALAQHYRLRQRRTPIEFGLSKVPMPITWEPTFAPPRAPLMKGHGMPQWRLGYGSDPQRIPDWWARRQHEMPQPLELTPEQKAAVDGLISQIKVALARNLNRMIDTFREFDEDYSGKIDTREFRLALHKLGIVAHKSAFDNTFDTLDHDRSGTIDYKELNNHFRREHNCLCACCPTRALSHAPLDIRRHACSHMCAMPHFLVSPWQVAPRIRRIQNSTTTPIPLSAAELTYLLQIAIHSSIRPLRPQQRHSLTTRTYSQPYLPRAVPGQHLHLLIIRFKCVERSVPYRSPWSGCHQAGALRDKRTLIFS